MRGVADGYGERVGYIERGNGMGRIEAKQGADHPEDLLFVRAAVTGDADLDGGRRVFAHRKTRFGGDKKSNTADMRELESAAGIVGVEGVLDGGGVGLMELDDVAKLTSDGAKAAGEIKAWGSLDRAGGNEAVARAV
jgi:hypothetical protein